MARAGLERRGFARGAVEQWGAVEQRGFARGAVKQRGLARAAPSGGVWLGPLAVLGERRLIQANGRRRGQVQALRRAVDWQAHDSVNRRA